MIVEGSVAGTGLTGSVSRWENIFFKASKIGRQEGKNHRLFGNSRN